MRSLGLSRVSGVVVLVVAVGPLTVLGGCSSDEGSATTPPPEGKAGSAGISGSGGKAGGGAAGSTNAGSGGGGSGGAVAGSAGTGGGPGGGAGIAGKGGVAGGAGVASGGGGGAPGGGSGAGGGGAGGGSSGAGGTAGGAQTGCAADPALGTVCSTKLKGACDVGHNKCIQGVLSCVPDFGPGERSETCNGLDDDCDGFTDNGLPEKTFFQDNDGDGFGSTATVKGCAAPPGYVDKSGDCNDTVATIYPGAFEACNGIDDNCNSAIDDGAPKKRFYKDNDGDLYGGEVFADACTAPAGYVAEAGDCQDNNAAIYPGANEVCNGLDDDCNGPVDDKLPDVISYRDVDGDGFAPANAEKITKCNTPAGYTLAKDFDGDGNSDWDCNDSANSVYPGATEVCGDGIDNSCSGAIDRLCFTACAGAWPYKLPVSENVLYAGHADLDGNGNHEVWVQDTQGFAVLTNKGAPLYQDSWTNLNYSRGPLVLADIDSGNQHTAAVQNVELLTGNKSYATFFKMVNGAVVPVPSTQFLYDASQFMATDFDRDGVPEFVSASWCEAARTKIYRYDPATGAINLVNTVDESGNACQYSNGRTLTDLDGDGVPELVAANGYAVPTAPANWGGELRPIKFTNPTTLTSQPFCAAGTCFSTAIDGLFGGGLYTTYRIGQEIRTSGNFFTSNTPGAANPSVNRFFRFDLSGKLLPGYPKESDDLFAGVTDVDRDGTPEALAEALYTGLFDVNGDGFPDRITSTDDGLVVDVWDVKTKTMVRQPYSALKPGASNGVRLLSVWDLEGDGRLDVISRDASGNVYCHSLGKDTWNKQAVLPPRFTPYLQTYQADPFEPNDGVDKNGDGVPDEVTFVPSALTTKGEFYGFLSHDADKDFYVLDTGYSANITVTSPVGAIYDLDVYSDTDAWNNDTKVPGADGKPDGLIYSDHSDNPNKSFAATMILPYRYGLYKFTVGISAHQGTKVVPSWPYWISSPK